ncbi:MAG: hypothetical protein A2170_07835 [Deltaproteobacteria bacterium RBG_13_53_10]|nr:MAG: hypothetical protein A2170_07835 [Deltaproteobacteria bacterium RBG_13_53_10]
MGVYVTGAPVFETGIEFNMNDDFNYAYNHGAMSAIVTGPGLPAEGLLFKHNYPETRYVMDPDPGGGAFYAIYPDSIVSAIPDNAEYTFTLCQETLAQLKSAMPCTVLQTYTDTVCNEAARARGGIRCIDVCQSHHAVIT